MRTKALILAENFEIVFQQFCWLIVSFQQTSSLVEIADKRNLI